ncbi:YqaA family protein [Chloroflexota bacterium]
MNETANVTQVIDRKSNSLKRRLVFFLALLLVIAITVGLHLVYGLHPERLEGFKSHFYWGAFLVSIIGNATIILPGAVLVILSNIGLLIYPVLGLIGPIIVGLVGGAGAAIGEITGYVAGYSGREVVKRGKMYSRVEGWVSKWGTLTIFLFSLVPFIFDLVGLVAGVLRFPFWKFILICWLGRTILYVVLISLAALGLKAVLPYSG